MVILGGIVDTGFLFWKDNAIASAVREGALFAIRVYPNEAAWNVNTSAAETATKSFITGITGGTNVTAAEISFTVTAADGNFGGADSIRITVNHTHQFLTPFNFAGSSTFNVTRSFATAFVANGEGTR